MLVRKGCHAISAEMALELENGSDQESDGREGLLGLGVKAQVAVKKGSGGSLLEKTKKAKAYIERSILERRKL